MPRRLCQTSFGLAIGLAARLALPGHPTISLLLAATLSLAGALGAGLAATRLLPAETLKQAGFVVSALGALAMLLIYGVVVQ